MDFEPGLVTFEPYDPEIDEAPAGDQFDCEGRDEESVEGADEGDGL